jgi:hypothetical protein
MPTGRGHHVVRLPLMVTFVHAITGHETNVPSEVRDID